MYLQKPCQTEKYFRFFYWRVIYFLASHILFTKTVPNYTEKANILRLSGKNIILGGVFWLKKTGGTGGYPLSKPIKSKPPFGAYP